MSFKFNHTNTFLRSALLENPDFLGDLLGPEDVLRIENEYPELFTAPFSIESASTQSNKQKQSFKYPSKIPEPDPDRFTRLSRPAQPQSCTREQCQPPSEPKPLKTSAGFMEQFKEKNKLRLLPKPKQSATSTGPARGPCYVQDRRTTRNKHFTIRKDDNSNESMLSKPNRTGGTVSSPSLKQNAQHSMENQIAHGPRNGGQLRKCFSAPVRSSNHYSAPVKSSGEFFQRFLQDKKYLLNNNNNNKKPQSSILKSISQEKQINQKMTLKNFPSTNNRPASAPTSPSRATPRNVSVTTRHALRSKSSGFLKPVPILLKKKPVLPTKSGDFVSERDGESVLTEAQETVKRIKINGVYYKHRSNLKDQILKEHSGREMTPNLSDILEERETETNASGRHNSKNDFSDSFISTCSSLSMDIFHGGNSGIINHLGARSDGDSLIKFKSNYQFKDPLLQEDKQSYLAQASLNRCEQLLLAQLLASKYEKEGKFSKSTVRSLRTKENNIKTSSDLQSKSQLPVRSGTSPRLSSKQSPVVATVTVVTPPLELEAAPTPIHPIHDVILQNFVQQNKTFETILHEKPRLLEEIAHDLIYAEVLKIIREEHELKAFELERRRSQPVMINKCVGTSSRSKSKSEHKQSQVPTYSPSVSSLSQSNSKVQCNVKPITRNSVSFEPLSENSNKNSATDNDNDNDAGRDFKNSNSSEIKSLDIENTASQSKNEIENEDYSEHFDAITESSAVVPSEQSQVFSLTNGNSEPKETSSRDKNTSKVESPSVARSPVPVPAPLTETNINPRSKSKSKRDDEAVGQILQKKKLDITDCDCSELEEDFIASEAELLPHTESQIQEQPTPEPNEESIKDDKEQPQSGLSTQNSFLEMDLQPHRGTASSSARHTPALPSVKENRSPASGSSTKKITPIRTPEVTKTDSFEKSQSRFETISIPTRTQPVSKTASKITSKSQNLPSDSNSILPILQLLDEAEKLQEKEEELDHSDSVSVPMGSENEEKLYKEIIAEINNSHSIHNDNDKATNLNDDNGNLDCQSVSQQALDPTDGEMESSCASILEDFISEGELVMGGDSAEEKSPGEICNTDCNNYYNFSPGMYSQGFTKY